MFLSELLISSFELHKSNIVYDELKPLKRNDDSWEVPKRMRIERPPNRAKVEYLENHEEIEENKAKCTSPHVFHSTFVFQVVVDRPGDPASRVDETYYDVHCHVVAVVEFYHAKVVAVVDVVDETRGV